MINSAMTEQDPAEIKRAHRELKQDLRYLVMDFRSKARAFPEETNAQRAATHFADKLEQTIDEHSEERE